MTDVGQGPSRTARDDPGTTHEKRRATAGEGPEGARQRRGV